MLDTIAQNVVIRLFHTRELDAGSRAVLLGNAPKVNDALKQLISFGIILEINNSLNSEEGRILRLNESFANSLAAVISAPLIAVDLTTSNRIDMNLLLEFAQEIWDNILLFILQFCEDIDRHVLAQNRSDPSDLIQNCLVKANLLSKVRIIIVYVHVDLLNSK